MRQKYLQIILSSAILFDVPGTNIIEDKWQGGGVILLYLGWSATR